MIDDTGETTVSEDPLQIGGLGDTIADPNITEPPKLWRSKNRNRERGWTKPYVLVPPQPTYLRIFNAKQLERAMGRRARIRPVSDGHISILGLEQRSSSRLLEEPGMGLSPNQQKML
jgi:hypothetical protein